jgi:hypothetical protein
MHNLETTAKEAELNIHATSGMVKICLEVFSSLLPVQLCSGLETHRLSSLGGPSKTDVPHLVK